MTWFVLESGGVILAVYGSALRHEADRQQASIGRETGVIPAMHVIMTRNRPRVGGAL